MIEHTLDKAHSILMCDRSPSLSKLTLSNSRQRLIPHIEERGALAGLIIEVAAFPGWDSFGAKASHFRFVRDHHKHIKKIGVVTDSPVGTVAENLASHFVAAEIKHFRAGELEAAKQWVMDRP
jgi:stage II sporulation SpoAA-like protein